ncbi:MAG: hypothetical protein JRI25_19655, partial [Deltaproteobacteria bacterium]|nr:hypothetical protein [Deltaproteobacteria bacterium]
IEEGADGPTLVCDDTTVSLGDDCTITDNGDGTSTLDCDGTTVVLGEDQVVTVSGTVAPGDSLTLTHGFDDAVVSAQYEEDGWLFPIADYPVHHSPVTSAGVDFTGGNAIGSHVRAALLSDGNIAVTFRLCVSGEFCSELRPNLMIVDTSGAEMMAPTQLVDLAIGERYDVSALSGGGFVAAWHDMTTLHVQRYDNAGTVVGSEITIDDAAEYSKVAVAGTSNGGFAVAYVEESEYAHLLVRYTDQGVADGEPVERTGDEQYDDYPLRLAALPNGGVVLLHNTGAANDVNAEVVFVDSSGTVAAAHILGTSYAYRAGFGVASNGNVCLVYELGGPDLTGYAVFEQDGDFLAGPEALTHHEPRAAGCGVFGDDDFAAVYVEDESQTFVLHNVTNAGLLLPGVHIFGATTPPTGEFARITISEREVAVMSDTYTSGQPGRMTTFTKGYLALQSVSDTEVRLVNQAAESVDVVVTAVGASP